MLWNDQGIIIHTTRHGERNILVSLLTREHGRSKGMMTFSSSNRLDTELGTLVEARWQARLREHLGRFQVEPVFSPFSKIVSSNEALLCLTSACTWLELLLPEHEPHPELFLAMHHFIYHVGDADRLLHYVKFEQAVLRATGIDLALDRCAATGQTHDLFYISPKTGRAVSTEAGAPYLDKLLKLPDCLRSDALSDAAFTVEDLLLGMDVLEYFLEHFVLQVHNLEIPNVRQRLRSCVARSFNHQAS